MSKLGWTAVGGLSVGVVALGLTVALGADDLGKVPWDALVMSDDCKADVTGIGEPNGAERRWAWTGGDEVEIAVPGTVHYRGGEGDQVIVKGDPNLVARIRVEGHAIKMCKGHRGSGRVDVTLPGTPFKNMVLAGSGDMILENVTVPKLELAVAGSGKLRAQGKSDAVELAIAGSGDADLSAYEMEKLELHIAGSGSAEAAPKDSLDLNIAGSGKLRLLSHPKHVESSIIGSGKIIQVADGATKQGD